MPRNEQGEEKGPDFYDDRFEESEGWKWHYSRLHWYVNWAIVMDRAARAGARSILDLGCGPGHMAQLAYDRGIRHYFGIDFSPKRIEQAKRVCPSFTFVVDDFFKSKLLKEHHYDAVFCFEVLEHIEEDKALIQRLRSGVRFYGTVPNFPIRQHVRYFNDTDEVYIRYKDVLDDLTVDEVISDEQRNRRFYILEGTIPGINGSTIKKRNSEKIGK